MDCSTPGLPAHYQLPGFTQTHVHWVSDNIQHLILCRPLLLLPSIFPSIRVFSSESVLCIRWPKYWSFSFSISPSNEHPGLISFRMDWLDLLAVQGTLKRLLQHHSSEAQMYTYILSLLNVPHPHHHLTPLGHHRALSWAACAVQRLPTSYPFCTWQCVYANPALPIFSHPIK